MQIILALFSVLLISACAGKPPAPGNPIVLEPQLDSLTPGMARIYFLRDAGQTSDAKLVKISVNGKDVGSIAILSSFFIDREPKKYRISVVTSGAPPESSIEIDVEANRRYYFQIAEHVRQSRNPPLEIGVAGGAVGGAIVGLIGAAGKSVYGISRIDPEVGEALSRKIGRLRSGQSFR